MDNGTIEDQFAVYQKILEPVLRERLELGKRYCSPIPRGDHYETTASFNVYEYKDRVFWKDWGKTDQEGHLPHHLLMALYPITELEARMRLSNMELPAGAIQVYRKSRAELEMFDRPKLNKSELDWYGQWNVSKKTLERFNTYGVDKLYIHGKDYNKKVFDKDWNIVSFSYRGGEDLTEYQWYQPDQVGAKKDFKRSGNFIYGWDQLPYKGEDLTILSGMKDGMVFYEACEEDFIAGSGEGAWRQIKALLPQLKRRFRRLWTLFDPDFPGVAATGKCIEELGIHPLPFKYPDRTRDVALLSRDFGKDWLRWKLDESFNRI